MKINKNFCFGVIMAFFIGIFLENYVCEIGPWRFLMIFLISYPYKVKSGRVYSLWGGFSDGDIRSLLSVFQIAEENAFSLISFNFYQRARKNAVSGIGINFFQRAWENASIVAGISVFQHANEEAKQHVGVNLFQKAGGLATFSFGLVGIQSGNKVEHGIGASLIQLGREKAELEMGVCFFQKAPWVRHFLGLILFQSFKVKNNSAISIAVFEEELQLLS